MLTSLQRAKGTAAFFRLSLLRDGCRGFCDASQNTALQGFNPGSIPPRVAHFQISLLDAQQRFEDWHSQHWLSPSRLWNSKDTHLRPVLLPYWLFEASVSVEYTAKLGFPLDGRQDGDLVWRETNRQVIPLQDYSWTQPGMQVYASYKYRRDLAEAGKVPGMLSRMRLLKRSEAADRRLAAAKVGWRAEAEVALDPPDMRQAIAWQFALRHIWQTETARAEAVLMQETQAKAVRDVRLQVATKRRRARVVYMPVYVVEYSFGSVFNPYGERRVLRYQAIVSGMADGGVAAERHYSPQKVRATTAVAVVAVGAAVSAVASPLLGMSMWEFVTVEAAFWTGMACLSAGLAARMAPLLLRRRSEARRVSEEDHEMLTMLGGGLSPLDPGDANQQAARSTAEWRRWEESEKWHWEERRRAVWAEDLWRGQMERQVARRRFLAERAALQSRLQEQERAEQRRRQRWGESAHGQAQFSGGLRAGGRADYLGYYETLGLSGETASEQDIKRAFRQAALETHPDRQQLPDQAARQRAEEKFLKLQRAYEVLRDPKRRRNYDAGCSGEHATM